MDNDERFFWVAQGWDAFRRGFSLENSAYIAGNARRTWIEGYNAAQQSVERTVLAPIAAKRKRKLDLLKSFVIGVARSAAHANRSAFRSKT
jgi:hypothetical protein